MSGEPRRRRTDGGGEGLSVVVPTWNAVELAVRAVSSLAPPPEGAELLVVDDGSDDDTVERLQDEFGDLDPERFRVLSLEENRGFGAAVNAGFREARGEWLSCVNNDAVVDWGTLQALVEYLEGRPRAAAAAPRLEDEAGSEQRVAFDFPRAPWTWFRRRWRDSRGEAGADPDGPGSGDGGRGGSGTATASAGEDRREPRSTAPYRAEYLKGACVVFRREALEEVGLFDEQYGMFAEELDLFRRLDARGWEAWVVPSATARHDEGSTSRNHPDRELSSRFRRQSYRSICIYYRKHHPWVAATLMRAVLALRVAGRWLRTAVRAAFGREDPWWLGEHARCLGAVLLPVRSRPREGRL